MLIDKGSSGNSGQPPADGFVRASVQPLNDELVKIALTSSRQGIECMICLLHQRNIIAGSEWSRPVKIKPTGEFISVATRRILTS